MPITENQAWAEAAASNDADQVMLVTLELLHSTFGTPIRAVRNNEDLVFRLEDGAPVGAGQSVLFAGIPFGIEYPRIGKLGAESTIWIDNVSREISTYLEAATKLNESVVVIFRGYLASDPYTVGHGPFRLLLRSVKRRAARLEGTLTLADPTNLRVLREVYDQVRFPSLMVATA